MIKQYFNLGKSGDRTVLIDDLAVMAVMLVGEIGHNRVVPGVYV